MISGTSHSVLNVIESFAERGGSTKVRLTFFDYRVVSLIQILGSISTSSLYAFGCALSCSSSSALVPVLVLSIVLTLKCVNLNTSLLVLVLFLILSLVLSLVFFKCAVDPVGNNADGSCLFKMVSPQVRNRLKIECRRFCCRRVP